MNGASSAAARLIATRPCDFSQGDRDALFAAVLAHDTVHPRPVLPPALHLDYDAMQLARCFHLSHQLWDTPDRIDALRWVARAVLREGRLDDAEMLIFKHVRARYKQLRFSYVLLDERHLYPRAFDIFTKVMSHLQDALTLGRGRAARGHALILYGLVGGVYARLVARELAGFRPTSAASFQDYVRRDVARLREAAEAGRMTGRQFHAIRKVISRQAALYDCLRVLYPSAYHDQVAHYISTINGLMGAMHDRMVARKKADSRSYTSEAVIVPDRISAMLLAFGRMHAAPAG